MPTEEKPDGNPGKSNGEEDLVRVVIDHRESGCLTVEALRSMPGVRASLDRLPLGDHEVDGRFLFERKTLVDLTHSIVDGRLFEQALPLAKSRVPSAIILEGTGSDLAARGMCRESIQGALITLTLFFGIPLLRSISGEETARLMVYAGRQAQAYATSALPRAGRRPRGKRRLQMALLQYLPGVGPRRARRLLDTFRTLEGVVSASVDDLRAVDGVGLETARAIWDAVHEAPVLYGHVDEPDPIL